MWVPNISFMLVGSVWGVGGGVGVGVFDTRTFEARVVYSFVYFFIFFVNNSRILSKASLMGDALLRNMYCFLVTPIYEEVKETTIEMISLYKHSLFLISISLMNMAI